MITAPPPMNCNSCRFELSQCLDGRLPSGRSAIVMQHVDECAGCADYWAELQAAQELVLRLPRTTVGGDFRDRLWARIRAGEGTPDAVFREPVPTMTKVRYALTGAAAAAAVLLAALWLRDNHPPADEQDVAIANRGDLTVTNDAPQQSNAVRIGGHRPIDGADAYDTNSFALVSSAQPLTANLVAMEAAKQFEQRLDNANWAMQRLRSEPDNTVALRQTFENVDELRGFGNLLLTLRERDRLAFSDNDVDADLRVAVNMLDEKRLTKRNLDTVRSVVAPALSSKNLGNLRKTIFVQSSIDPREEIDVLWRLTTMQPEVFAQMFFVMGNPDDTCESFGLPRRNDVFVLQGQCGPQWVSPRSNVGKTEIRILRIR